MRLSYRFVPVLLGLAVAACSADDETGDPGGGTGGGTGGTAPLSASLTALVGPGQHAAIRIEPLSGSSTVVDPTPVLSEAAEQAVARAPAWLRGPLRIRLSLAGPVQGVLAALINDAPADHLVDEIAFTVANLPETDLQSPLLDPAVITENAEAIYDFAAQLPYVEIVDSGSLDGGDLASTVRYRLLDESAQPVVWELPQQDYYWWVVHPKIDAEQLWRVDPTTGLPAGSPAGVFWRRYLLESSQAEGAFDYRDHFILRVPNDLRGQDLGLTASAHLTGMAIYPLRLFVDEAARGLLVEIDLGGGTVLASTLSTAQPYADGAHDLHQNLCRYGNTNVLLSSGASVALVLDESPWGTDVYSAALGIIQTQVVTSAELATLDLAPLRKVIVAADQPAALYQAVADRTADLESWVQAGGVLQLDLHTSADLSALTFVNGLQVAGGAPAEVLAEGQPLLGDHITESPVVWDGQSYPGLSGDRPPPGPQGMALDTIGWVVTQNMYDNVAEHQAVAGSMNTERSQFPQRIIHNHYGNCGELADTLVATGRASLLPVRQAVSVEDHVWNEVLLDDRWVPWQVDWSDGPTRIDNPGVAADSDHGGGKTVSGVWTMRGDGYPLPSPAATYTDTCTLDITVMDSGGRPVDGALLLIATESFYDPDSLSLAGFAYTGADGAVELSMGNDRNYWIYVSSEAGGGVEYPEDDGDLSTIKVEPLATVEETAGGAVVSLDVTLDVTLAPPSGSDSEAAGEGVAAARGTALRSWLVAESFITESRFIAADDPSAISFYLLDQAGYDAWLAGGDFAALGVALDAAELDLGTAAVPLGEPVWLVAYNASVTKTTELELQLELFPSP